MFNPFQLKIVDRPLLDICQRLGGIHKAIQIVDMLMPKTEFFALSGASKDQTLKEQNVIQYRHSRNSIKRLLVSRTWTWAYMPDVCSREVYEVEVFLKELEHAINHGVFVPENVYFQTMDQIKRVRSLDYLPI